MAKKTLLLVEDDPDTQAAYKDLFTDYNIVQVYDTAKAAEALKKKKIDLIVLDIMLPKQTGDEFLKELRQDPKYKKYRKIPVVCVSVISEKEDEYKKIDPTMAFIAKPFSNQELLAVIKKKIK
jgi:two-component system response regulator VanR